MISKGVEHSSQIMGYFRDNQSSMENFLKTLVSIESPSSDPSSQDDLFHLLGKELSELGYFTLRMYGTDTGGYLYARPKSRNKKKKLQLLVGHCDTVWAKNTIDKMPIYQQNGKITGPGIYDMKAGLTQIIYALRAIHQMGLSMPLEPLILINSDEEIGSSESGHAIARLAKTADRAYILEPPLGLDGRLKTARKGIGRFTLTVEGKAAHAGLDPDKGVNAIVELSYLIQKLYAMNDFERGITVNVGMVEGGVSPNVVAPKSSAVVDVRVSTSEDGEWIAEQIRSLEPMSSDVNLHIEGGIGRPPMERTPRNQALWKMARSKGATMGLDLKEAMAGGGSDGNTTSLYTATLDGLGTTGDGAHAAHEHVITDQLPERTALLTLLLLANEVEE